MEDIKEMMLTPLEETVAGQELIQLGRYEEKKESAANMLKMGMDVKTISKITGNKASANFQIIPLGKQSNYLYDFFSGNGFRSLITDSNPRNSTQGDEKNDADSS
ncbi:MAG: hypothetical protein GY795_34320 [Desulfobacterales bacterium]|nr:hypothetical protein [Desulfobacterales bacterium]